MDRQQLCCIRIEPQALPICLQQARSIAFICAEGIAHAMVGASRDRTSTTLQIVRLSPSIYIQHIEHGYHPPERENLTYARMA